MTIGESTTLVFKIVRDSANRAQLWIIEKLHGDDYRCRRLNFDSDELARQARYFIRDARKPQFDTDCFLGRAAALGCEDESATLTSTDRAIAYLCQGADQALHWNARTMLSELNAGRSLGY